jgi:hypothetical protein
VVRPTFLSLPHPFQREFFRHLDCLQAELTQIRTPATANDAFPWNQQLPLYLGASLHLLRGRTLFQRATCCADPRPNADQPLPNFVAATSTPGRTLEQRYATLLHASERRLRRVSSERPERHDRVHGCRSRNCSSHQRTPGNHNDIVSSLGPQAENERMLAKSGLWPQISPRSLLERLTISQRHLLSAPWKGKLLDYAQAIAMVQRARRISELSSQEHQAEYEREANNDGQSGWDPLENPDWLLVELESNLLIRQVQAEIATEMLRTQVQAKLCDAIEHG